MVFKLGKGPRKSDEQAQVAAVSFSIVCHSIDVDGCSGSVGLCQHTVHSDWAVWQVSNEYHLMHVKSGRVSIRSYGASDVD
jgi:hypothetical protein